MKDCKLTNDFIDNIYTTSSDIKEIVPALIPPVSIHPASVDTTPSETVSKEDQKMRKQARLKANQVAKKLL